MLVCHSPERVGVLVAEFGILGVLNRLACGVFEEGIVGVDGPLTFL